jgi:cobalt-zinc-cadmium efflux system protein
LITASGLRILFDSANLLLDSVPREIDSAEVSRFLQSDPNVRAICDLHIWGVSSNEAMLTAHLVVETGLDRDAYLAQVTRALRSRFNLAHMTLQLESSPQDTCHDEW